MNNDHALVVSRGGGDDEQTIIEHSGSCPENMFSEMVLPFVCFATWPLAEQSMQFVGDESANQWLSINRQTVNIEPRLDIKLIVNECKCLGEWPLPAVVDRHAVTHVSVAIAITITINNNALERATNQTVRNAMMLCPLRCGLSFKSNIAALAQYSHTACNDYAVQSSSVWTPSGTQ